jgi:hypothetical protein
MKASFQTRIDRIERALHVMFHSQTFTMPDGSKTVLYRRQVQKAYRDAMARIDSPEARIILNAVDDGIGNGGIMLQLLKAVLLH